VPKPVTIRSFLPQREIEICQRLRDVRIAVRLQQAEFAKKLGISRVKLASHEYAKAPIRYELGKQFCYRFNVNQRWFATGKLPKSPYFDISPNLEFQITPRALFSGAFDKVLADQIENRGAELARLVGKDALLAGEFEEVVMDNLHLVGEFPSRAMAFYVTKLILTKLNWLPGPLQVEYGNALLAAEKRFHKKHWKQIKALVAERLSKNSAAPAGREPKKEFDSVTVESNMEGVKSKVSETQRLRDDLKHATAKPGMKAKLARFMKVDPPRVSEWLSGQEPGGEYALKLRAWADEQLGQKRKT